MSMFIDDEVDRVVYEESGDEKKDLLDNISSRINKGGEPPTAVMEREKRMRREIANSNERRRMQSINNGFQSLRSLLPHHEGEKLSKAAILQQTAEYIYSLEQEKTRLLSQNCQLKRLVNQHEGGELPPKKRKTELTALNTISAESSDEGLGSMSPEPSVITVVTADMTMLSNTATAASSELKRQLERERSMRLLLEEQVRQLQDQMLKQLDAGSSSIPATPQMYQVDEEDMTMQLVTADSLPPVGHTQTVVSSPPDSRCASPEPVTPENLIIPDRLPSVLEAAIKAEPKVEVERLPSPNPSVVCEDATQVRLYSSNTSRQNLETIVEAIRHLEGDHMFGEPQAQVSPLALTTSRDAASAAKDVQAYLAATTVQQHQQSRPGVIVVKQAS